MEGADEVGVRFERGERAPWRPRSQGSDPSTDLAVLKVDPDDAELVPLPLGDSRRCRSATRVDRDRQPVRLQRTVTTGIVSALQRQIEAPNGFPIRNVIQTDASINPGNSGGPLLDGSGRVIGINSQIATGGSSGSVGIGFAVPVNTAKELLPQLKKGGEVERAYLGVEMADGDRAARRGPEPARRAGRADPDVVDGGPADDAGLRGGRTPIGEGLTAGGDLIVEVDGKDDQGPRRRGRRDLDNKPGDEVEVEYYRGDDKRRRVRSSSASGPQQLEQPSAAGRPAAALTR